MDNQKSSNEWETKKTKIDRICDKIELENRHGIRPSNHKIGSYYKYDHKITSTIATILVSNGIILQQSVFSYLYLLGSIKIIKDTAGSGLDSSGNYHLEKIKLKPLIYYLAAASIIIVAALTSNHVIPGIEGGLTYYTGKVIP